MLSPSLLFVLVFVLAVILKIFLVEDSYVDDRFLFGIIGTGLYFIINQLEKIIEIMENKL